MFFRAQSLLQHAQCDTMVHHAVCGSACRIALEDPQHVCLCIKWWLPHDHATRINGRTDRWKKFSKGRKGR